MALTKTRLTGVNNEKVCVYSFTNHHQITVLPWCTRFYYLCFMVLMFQLAIDLYVILEGVSNAALLGLIAVFIASGSFMMKMFRHGKARIDGQRITIWNWGVVSKTETDGQSMERFESKLIDAQYLAPFQAHLQYLNSLRETGVDAFNKPEVICFDGGVLKPWEPHDIETYITLFSNEELMSWHDVPIGILRQARQSVHYSSTRDTVRSLWTYMLLNESGETCGHVELRLLGAHGLIGEISFGLLESHRGRGYMNSALTSMFAHLSMHLHLETLVARTRLSNTNCQKLLQRLGFIATADFEAEWMLGPCEASDLTYVRVNT